jgi:CDP-diglyceride synthetase
MADFPLISITAGLLILVPVYLVAIYARKFVFIIASFACVLLALLGYFQTTGTASQQIFAALGAVAGIGLFISMLYTFFDWIVEKVMYGLKMFGGY